MGKIRIPIIPRPNKNKDNSSNMFQYLSVADEQYSVADEQYSVGDFIIAVEHYTKTTVYGEIVKKFKPAEENYIVFNIKPAEISPNGQKIDVGDTIWIVTSTEYTFFKTTKKGYIDSVKTTLEENIKTAKADIRQLHQDILTYQKNLREIK